MRIALLTGGGDSSAINAAIRAVVRKCIAEGYEVIGIKRGWRGLIQDEVEPLFIGSSPASSSGAGPSWGLPAPTPST